MKKYAKIILISFLVFITFNIGFHLFSQEEVEYFLGYDEPDLKIDNNSPLSLNLDDVVFVKRNDSYFDIYIRKKDEIESVLITSIPKDENYVTKEIYGLRGTDYNPVNGNEPRLFDGEFLKKKGTEYFLVDSTPEPALPFFNEAYHILVPPVLEYGYEYAGQFGTISLKEGMNINIRTYNAKYADNRSKFCDNIFKIKFGDNPPTITLLGYEEINDNFIKIFVQYDDDKDFDSLFIRETAPKNEKFKMVNITNNVVPEDMSAQLKGTTNNLDGSISLRIHIDIKRPTEKERTITITAIDKSANSAKSPITFTIKPSKKTEEKKPDPIDASKYDDRTIKSFDDISEKTGGKSYIAESPEGLPAKIIQAIKDSTEGYNGDDVDLVFAIDSTGSMIDDIDYVKKELKSILRTISDCFQFANIGIVLYKDRSDEFITKGFPFTQDVEKVKMQIDSIRPAGGGDKPEAVIDALYYTITEFKWTAGKRIIILIGDAPPHEKSLDGKKIMDDVYKAAMSKDITIQIYTITVPDK